MPLHLGADLEGATTHLANTGVGRAVSPPPNHQHPAALDAVREALQHYLDEDGVHLGGAIFVSTATTP